MTANTMNSGKPRKNRKRPAPIGGSLPNREVLTTLEVARMLRVSTSSVARWAREGKIPCHFTLGGHRRFERAAIEALAESVDRLEGWRETASDRRGRSQPKSKRVPQRKARRGV